ncbi:MAG: hypothetical protein ACI87N_002590 [Flavobacteriales bacterium]|jgi:hypothetical protein
MWIDGAVVKLAQYGEWVNKYWIDGDVVKKAINGEWQNETRVERAVIKTSENVEWVNFAWILEDVSLMSLAVIIEDWR